MATRAEHASFLAEMDSRALYDAVSVIRRRKVTFTDASRASVLRDLIAAADHCEGLTAATPTPETEENDG